MNYNVLHYGARADGTLCTAQLQRAIDDCFLGGGGEVTVPSGVYLTGGLRLRSNVTLHLLENAVLLGSVCPEDYSDYLNDMVEPISQKERETHVSTVKPGAKMGDDVYPHSRWNNAIIRAIGAKNIAIIGEQGAEINGQNCFDPLGEEGYRGPHAINMWFCENVTLHGYTIRDSANWAHAIQNSRQIRMRAVTVLGGHDGFDARTCDDVAIEDCRFLTGDDCIAGFDNLNVTVRNCYFESACSIFRFGATDMLVEDCRSVAPATYGHRYCLSAEEKRDRVDTNEACRHNCLNVFLYYCDNRASIRKTPGNILIRRCSFEGPDAIMRLPFGHMWCCNRSLRDISFEDCLFNGICMPMRLECPAEEPLSLYMKDCTVIGRSGAEDTKLIVGKNLRAVTLERVAIRNLTAPESLSDPPIKVIQK